MEKRSKAQAIVVGIIILFVGAGVFPIIQAAIPVAQYQEISNTFVQITTQMDGDTTSITYQIPEVRQESVLYNNQEYVRVVLPKEAMILEQGNPDLPTICRSIIIPDSGIMDVKIASSHYDEYSNVNVIPSKGNLYRTVNPDTIAYTWSETYTTNAWYPEQLAGLSDPYILRDYRGQVVMIHPCQYNPVTKVLRCYTELTVEIYPVEEGGINVLRRAQPLTTIDTDFSDVYAHHFLNFGGDRYNPVNERGNMLVITYDGFYDAMLPFVQWKNMKGIPTQLVRVSTIGTTAAAIKSYITTYYNQYGLTFVLLVGDAAQIPTFSSYGGASDPTYSFILGGDHYSELFVGRFSASTVSQVQTQVLRSVEYEQLPQTGAAWYHKGVGIASNQGPGDDNEYDYQHIRNIRTDLLGYIYTDVDELYDGSQGGGDAAGNPTTTMVANSLNNGRSIINYCGHGSATSWGTTGFSNSNVNTLQNDNMLPFIWSVACNNGEFNNYDACFAEAWLRATHNGEPIGAIGAFMSSISQSWNPPMAAQDESVDILVESYANNKKNTFGALSYCGCMLMNDQYGSDGWEMTDTWHVFGDPSLQVRTNTPGAMTVQHNPMIPSGATTFQVTVVGLKDALCAISKDFVLLGSAYTDVNGLATITFTQPITQGPVDLVVTAYNKIPYMTQLTVGSGIDPALSFVTLTHTNMPGMTTCPKGDGPAYKYVKVTVKNTQGQPVSGIPASGFTFQVMPLPGTRYYGLFTVTLNPVDIQTNVSGEIRFNITTTTSIVGNVTIKATVQGVRLNDIDTLGVKSYDMIYPDGDVDLSDFALFAQDYFRGTAWRSDYSWDGLVNLIDFSMFAPHYGHRHP